MGRNGKDASKREQVRREIPLSQFGRSSHHEYKTTYKKTDGPTSLGSNRAAYRDYDDECINDSSHVNSHQGGTQYPHSQISTLRPVRALLLGATRKSYFEPYGE